MRRPLVELPSPGIRVWFATDIANIIVGVALANRRTAEAVAQDSEVEQAYQLGFQHALEAVAMAFGLRLRWE